ncbi:MAG: hypothetical protein IJV39_03220 [Ruminococcus sp.]|nr:hypothetical protein [Ruminococcus sp.]
MSKKNSKKLRFAVHCVLAFVVSLLLFVLAYSVVLQTTFLNSDYLIESMNASNYFADKKEEVVQDLTDLGYASGVDEKFFEDFITEVKLSDDTNSYLTAYYDGSNTQLDTTSFKRDMLEELQKYAKQNNLGEVNQKNVQYLIDKAAVVYRNSIEIPLFSKAAGGIHKLQNNMPLAIFAVVIVILVISAVIFFTNKWKHRAVKFYFASFAGAFLSVVIFPAFMLITNYISKINIESRALYNTIIYSVNNFFVAVLICSVLYLLLSAVMFFLYGSLRKKASK